MDNLTAGHEANNSSVQVEIFDQAFNLRGDPDYIRELAEHVDSMMRVLADKTMRSILPAWV